MATFAQLKTYISRRLQDENNTAISTDDVGYAVNAAISFYKKERFWFNDFVETKTLTIGDRTLPLPTTNSMLYPFDGDGLMVTESENKYPITRVRGEEYDRADSGNTGRPYVYTYRGGVYQCYFIPSQAYTITWSGLKDYADLQNDTDTNDMIMYEALSNLAGEFMQDDVSETKYKVKAEIEKNMLLSRTHRLTETGELAVYDF
jgi:hypothetical protein